MGFLKLFDQQLSTGIKREKPLVLNGQELSKNILSDVKKRVSEILPKLDEVPKLATILVGDDVASATYVKMKRRTCEKVGMESVAVELPAGIKNEDLFQTIRKLNDRPDIHGILLQHPIPRHLDERQAFDLIDIKKDVDGVTALGFGKMSMQSAAYGSATPTGIMKLLAHYQIALQGKHVVVLGRSPILGKPMSMMLLNSDATVTICHSKTKNIENLIGQADILVAAVGKPEFVKSDWIKEGAVVVDAGYHKLKAGSETIQVGDVESDGLLEKASAFTPVPGGVGPMTIATLVLHTLESAEKTARSEE
jgi:methylenetetrahydrofolate dehydrogenase (NADP+)/methenyltetrahydrofolate cyclohydrolase